MHLLCVIEGVVRTNLQAVCRDCGLSFDSRYPWYEGWRLEDVILREVLVDVLLALITGSLVVRPLALDNPEVLLGCLDYTGLGSLWVVCGSKDGSAILLARPAEVRHGLHQSNRGELQPPQLAKGGVCYSVDVLRFLCSLEVHIPDAPLGRAGWQQLDVITTVAWHSSW